MANILLYVILLIMIISIFVAWYIALFVSVNTKKSIDVVKNNLYSPNSRIAAKAFLSLLYCGVIKLCVIVNKSPKFDAVQNRRGFQVLLAQKNIMNLCGTLSHIKYKD